MVKFLILSGDGINCERESSMAFEHVGFETKKVSLHDLCNEPKMLSSFDGLCLPGGFSFGDELGAGLIMAYKMNHYCKEELDRFILNEKPILGICNGFQILVRLGILPHPFEKRTVALAMNMSGQYIDRWVDLNLSIKSSCHWIKSYKKKNCTLPIRHKEGQIVLKKGEEELCYERLYNQGQIPFTYTEKINGSFQNIAALCDPKGLILGMMPHPEAALFKGLSPFHSCDEFLDEYDGMLLFKSIALYFKEQV